MTSILKTISLYACTAMCMLIWQRHGQARPWRRTRYYRGEPASPLPTWHSVESANCVELDRRTGRWSCEVNGRTVESDNKSVLESMLDEMEATSC
jgi:hypothetical protein